MYTEVSRGFGFLRFRTLEESKAFVEGTYPTIYLYGKGTADNDDQAAKVRIAYSREREDRGRPEKSEAEWTCKLVSRNIIKSLGSCSWFSSVPFSIFLAVSNAIDAMRHNLVRDSKSTLAIQLTIPRYGSHQCRRAT